MTPIMFLLHFQDRLASRNEKLALAQLNVLETDGGVAQTELVTPTMSTHSLQHQSKSMVATTKGLYAHKLKSHTNRLRQQTNRLMSNFKGQSLNCTPVRRYNGHKDGIWEVSVSRLGLPIIGTASADHTAMIWGMHSGKRVAINDPLGRTHSPTSSDHYFQATFCSVLRYFEQWGRTDGHKHVRK